MSNTEANFSKEIHTEMWVPASLEEVWNFFSDSKNLEKITPAWFGASVKAEGGTRNGTQMELNLNPLGIKLGIKWLSELSKVVDVGPTRQFVDTQKSGPFKFWQHTHRFEAGSSEVLGQRSGAKVKSHAPGTWIYDDLVYTPPLGAIGSLANSLLIEKSLVQMFVHRRKRLQEIFSP